MAVSPTYYELDVSEQLMVLGVMATVPALLKAVPPAVADSLKLVAYGGFVTCIVRTW